MKWALVFATVMTLCAVGCSPIEEGAKDGDGAAPAVAGKKAGDKPKEEAKSSEPTPFAEPGNEAYVNARRLVLEALDKFNGTGKDWEIPENSGYGKVVGDNKDKNYFQVTLTGSRKNPDVTRKFKVLLYKDKVTGEWIADKTDVNGK